MNGYGWLYKSKHNFGWLSKIQDGGSSGLIPDPAAVLTLRSDFLDGNITPETGYGGTFARTGGNYYASSNTDTGLGLAGTGVACVEGFVYGDTSFSNGGIQITGTVTNHCLQASLPATSPWGLVGTAAASNNFTTGPDNTANSAARLLLTAVGDGVRQQVAAFTNVSGRGFVFSVYLRAASGTEQVTLKAYNDTDTESSETVADLTTTWQRFSVYVKFGIGITNGLRVEVTGNETSQTIYWYGAQVEECGAAYGNMSQLPCNPVRTTTIVAAKNPDDLTYPSSNLSTLSSGSINVWVAPFFNASGMSDESTDCEKYLFSINGTDAAITIGYNTTSNQFFTRGYYGAVSVEVANTNGWTANQWQMYTLTWSNLNSTISLKLYKDGTLIGSNTTSASPATISANTIYIGRATSGTNSTYINGIVSLFKYYTGVLTESEVASQYTTELANF